MYEDLLGDSDQAGLDGGFRHQLQDRTAKTKAPVSAGAFLPMARSWFSTLTGFS